MIVYLEIAFNLLLVSLIVSAMSYGYLLLGVLLIVLMLVNALMLVLARDSTLK